MINTIHHMVTKHSRKNNQDLNAIEKELITFFEYCNANGYTKDEIQVICKPLTSVLYKNKIRRYIFYIISVLLTILFIYFNFETISWHFSAIGRIILIKLLPVWNWEKLTDEKCLIPNVFLTTNSALQENRFDCNVCEAIDKISVETNIDPYKLSEIYLDLNVPVIIADGLQNYPSNNEDYNITAAILADEKLVQSYPCELSSNMLQTSEQIESILLKSFKFKNWYFHFQNCDFQAVKQFRLVAPRPYFLRPEIMPIQYSWFLMSLNYKSPKYKKLELVEKIAVFGQIEGSNFIKLTPRLNCVNECPTIEIELQKDEVLVFTSLWDLEYTPNKLMKNVAVILETR